MIEQSPQLDEYTCFDLAAAVARYSLLPHPEVVAQFDRAVFPTRRIRRADTVERYEITPCGSYVLDDNVSPRWALLWTHGYRRQTVAPGWQLAHTWEIAGDPAAFTNLANLAFVPKSLTRLTDSSGAAEPFLQYHAATTYGWTPLVKNQPVMPARYAEISWNYLPVCIDAKSALRRASSSEHVLMRNIRQTGWVV